MKVSVRLSANALPLPQVPQSTPEPVTPAAGMVLGQVQILKGVSRVGLHIVIVETSEVVQTGQGTASGDSIDTVQAAAEDALAALTMLNTA